MFSIPPATTMSFSPSMMLCAPNDTDFSPLAHTLLMVVAGTWSPMPANFDACLAGACPTPACNTQPMKTSFTWFGSMPAFSKAPLIAMAPNCVAGTLESAPLKLPMGVLAAATIKTSFVMFGKEIQR